MGQKVRFAVVGMGRIGKRHASMIAGHPDAELISVCDIDPAQVEDFEMGDSVRFYDNVEDLLANSDDVDVVHVCTPNGLHAFQSLKALDARKHVVIEKPMGLKKSECEMVIFKSLESSRNVFCVMQNRYSPPSMWLKEIVSEGTLGEIYMVQVNCFWNRDARYYKKNGWKGTKDMDGGVLYTQFSHFIDIMYWLFGDITNIKGRITNFSHQESTEFEDSGMVNFDFVNGGMGSLSFTTSVTQQNMESSITIIGEKGSVKVGGQYMDQVEYCVIPGYEMPELKETNPPNHYPGGVQGSASNHEYVIQNVIDTLGGKTAITTNALEGLKVVEIIERIYSSTKEAVMNGQAVHADAHSIVNK